MYKVQKMEECETVKTVFSPKEPQQARLEINEKITELK